MPQPPTLPPRPGRRSHGGALPRRVFKLASQGNQGGGHSPSSSVRTRRHAHLRARMFHAVSPWATPSPPQQVDAAVIAQGGALEFHTLRVRVAASDVVGLRERPTPPTASVVDAPQAQQVRQEGKRDAG